MARSWWQPDSTDDQQDPNAWWKQPSFFGNLTTDPSTDNDNHPSFFGSLAHSAGNTIHGVESLGKGVGSFFGGMVKDIAHDAVSTVKTTKNIGEGVFHAVTDPGKIDKNQEEMQQATHDYQAGKITLDDLNKKYKDFQSRAQEISKGIANEGINKDKDSALSQGAAAGNTFLNAATLGIGGGLKSLAEGGAREIVKEGATSGGKAAARKTAQVLFSNGSNQASRAALHEAVDQGGSTAARAAAGHFGEQVGGNALIGGVQGAMSDLDGTQPGKTTGDIWHDALLGGLTGGAVGAGGSLLNKDVRTGLREVPGEVSSRAQEVFANRPLLNQAGGVAPFGGDASGHVRPPKASDLAQEVAAHYSSPEQYVKEAADHAYEYDKGQTGGQLQPSGDGYVRTSSHTPFYSQYFAENGRAPSKAAFRDQIQKALETGTDGGGIIDSQESEAYKLLQEKHGDTQSLLSDPSADFNAARQQHLDALNGNGDLPAGAAPTTAPGVGRVPAGLPARPGTGQLDINGQPFAPDPTSNAKMPAGLPKGPQRGQEALPGQSAEEQTINNPGAAQTAANEQRAAENNLVDFIDPHKVTDLGKNTPTQGALETAPGDPYAGWEADLTRPALGPGKTELTPAEAKDRFKQTGNAPVVSNPQAPGDEAIPLHATSEETNNAAAVRETPGGKTKLLANNNAHITKDVVAAIRHIADDDTGSRFTSTRTHELNLEEATQPRGGDKSPEFRSLAKLPQSIRQHTAEYTGFIDKEKSFAKKFVKQFDWDAKKDLAARQYIEAETPEARETVAVEFKKQFGSKSAAALEPLRTRWIAQKEQLRGEANSEIEKYAGKDRTIGDLGENYLTRVYKRGGVKGFKNAVIDLTHSKLDAIGGKGKGALFNLENPDGYLSKESDTAGGVLRGSEGIPLNSEHAKPNTVYLSAAQKRTAQDPQGELEGALSSMMHYYQAVGKAKYFTKDIATGRTTQKAIEMVNNETGNLRQMYQSYDDMINSVAGKTSRLDRYFTDTKTGNNVVNAATKIQRNIGRSTILGSANSALAQTGQLPLVFAETGPKNFTKGMQDMFHFLGSKNDAADPINSSSLLKTRYPANEDPFQVSRLGRASNKTTDVVAKPFRIIEKAASQFAWRSSYNKALADGFKGADAVNEADRITAKLIGERSPGARAALYESKALGPITSYTLEVNQMYQVAKQYFKHDPKKAAALVGAVWLYNQGYQHITGNKLNADPLAAGIEAGKTLATDTDSDGNPIGLGERLGRATGRIAGEAIDATPLGDTVAAQLYPTNGFRIPFGGGNRALTRADVFGDTNLGRYGGGTPIASGLANPLLLTGIPGMAQLQRSVEGNNVFQSGASTTAGGTQRFAVDPTLENYWRALLFGQYGTAEGRQYLADQNANLSGR